MEIGAENKNLREIYTDKRLLLIPVYQRAYEWRRRDLYCLIIDLVKAYNSSSESDYFCGMMIFCKLDDKTIIVDGQQRLTTFELLLRVMDSMDIFNDDKSNKNIYLVDGENRFVHKNENETKKAYEEVVEYIKSGISDQGKRTGKHYVPEDYLKGSYRKYYERHDISKDRRPDWSDPQMRMMYAADLFRQFCDKPGERREGGEWDYCDGDVSGIDYAAEKTGLDHDALYSFKEWVLDHIKFSVLYVQNEATARTIFRSTNTAGKPLEDYDIIKFDCIEKIESLNAAEDIKQNSVEEFMEKWDELVEFVGNLNNEYGILTDFRDLYEYIIICNIYYKKVNLENIKDAISAFTEDPKKFIGHLINFKKHVSDILKLKENEESNLNKKILAIFPSKRLWIPFLAKYYKDAEKCKAFAKLLLLCQMNYPRASYYINDCIEIIHSDDPLESIKSYIESNELINSFIEQYHGDKRSKAAPTWQTMILRLDAILNDAEESMNTFKSGGKSGSSIEHVRPQNPAENSDWENMFQGGGQYVQSIGNKILLQGKINSMAKNNSFNNKKAKAYKASKGYYRVNWVMNKDKWNKDSVAELKCEYLKTLNDNLDLGITDKVFNELKGGEESE
jgi:uncharacterized protein with ParB-like and HNH nuclease domain